MTLIGLLAGLMLAGGSPPAESPVQTPLYWRCTGEIGDIEYGASWRFNVVFRVVARQPTPDNRLTFRLEVQHPSGAVPYPGRVRQDGRSIVLERPQGGWEGVIGDDLEAVSLVIEQGEISSRHPDAFEYLRGRCVSAGTARD